MFNSYNHEVEDMQSNVVNIRLHIVVTFSYIEIRVWVNVLFESRSPVASEQIQLLPGNIRKEESKGTGVDAYFRFFIQRVSLTDFSCLF